MIGDFSKIEQDFKAILSYSQAYPFDIDPHRLLDQWLKAKSHFIERFGGKTIWHSDNIIKINLSDEAKQRKFDAFLNDVSDVTDTSLVSFLQDNKDGFFSNVVVKDYPSLHIQKGAKLLKSFKQFEPDVDIRTHLQEVASKYIQEDKIQGYLCLSVDPRDYLTLSENCAKWKSCHTLDGDYRAGNLNYMVDDVTIIAYLCSETPKHYRGLPDGMKWTNKRWRALVHVKYPGVVYINRHYPFQSEILESKVIDTLNTLLFPRHAIDFRAPVGFNEIIVDGSKVKLNKNSFCLHGRLYNASEIIDDKDNLGYSDLINSPFYTPVAYTREDDYFMNRTPEQLRRAIKIKIGEQALCPCCGEGTVYNSRTFLCKACVQENDAYQDFYEVCAGCGRHIYDYEDGAEEVDGDLYCAGCLKEMARVQNLPAYDFIWNKEEHKWLNAETQQEKV